MIDPDNFVSEKCQAPTKPIVMTIVIEIAMPILITPNEPCIFQGSFISLSSGRIIGIPRSAKITVAKNVGIPFL